MFSRIRKWIALAIAFSMILCAPMRVAQAQWAVIDVAAIAQAVKQYAEAIKQYEQLVAQLKQAKQIYEAATGKRGFENLLMGEIEQGKFDYLPPDARSAMLGARDAIGASAGLAKEIDRLHGQVTSLTKDTFGGNMDSPSARVWQERVNQLAGMQATNNAAQKAAVARVDSNKQLVNAIGSTTDAKSIGELQARIAAQQSMLLNEQIRLFALAESNKASQEQLAQMQSDMLIKMDQRPVPKVAYGK